MAEKYVEERRFYDGPILTIGQQSKYAYKHIIVAPDDRTYYLSLEGSYSEAKVMSYSWEGSVFLEGYGTDSVIYEVEQFAARLREAYKTAAAEGFPAYTQPMDTQESW